MIVGRLLGWLLLIFGVVVLGRDLLGRLDTHRFEPVVLGALWGDLDRGSLDAAQVMIQRHVSPVLWDPVIAALLQWWASPVFLAIGLLLIVALRRRDDRSARRRRR
jgi:hypothetical protein